MDIQDSSFNMCIIGSAVCVCTSYKYIQPKSTYQVS